MFLQFMHSLDSSWHRLHQSKQTWYLVQTTSIFSLYLLTHLVESRLEVHQHIVHVNKYSLRILTFLLVCEDNIVTLGEKFKNGE